MEASSASTRAKLFALWPQARLPGLALLLGRERNGCIALL